MAAKSNAMINKADIGRGFQIKQKELGSSHRSMKDKAKREAMKVPVFVKELNMTLFLVPGTNVIEVINKYKGRAKF